MILGVTGTRRGCTTAQHEQLARLLGAADELRHGDCIGVDAQAHALVLPRRVVIHPPVDPKERAWCEGAAVVLEPRPYLVRNHDIVDASDEVIAVPGEEVPQARGSGTWATIRYAQKVERPLTIIYPGGRVTTC